MCLIVDANRLGDLLTQPPNDDVQPIRDWVESGGKIVYSTGGKFAAEIGRRARTALAELGRRGRAVYIPDEVLGKVAGHPAARIRSDDPHILALAEASGARVLFTHDRALMADFTNKDIIRRPRGKVYYGARNSDLLDRWAACR